MSRVTLGFFLFSHLTIGTSQWLLTLWMVILGVGIGLFMQVMTLAVQNSVDRKDLGTATSVVIFSRTIGSSLGAAIFGAILTSRLTFHLQQAATGAGNLHLTAQSLSASPKILRALPPAVHQNVLEAFARSFHDVFLFGIPFAVAAFLVSLALRETPLKTTTRNSSGE